MQYTKNERENSRTARLLTSSNVCLSVLADKIEFAHLATPPVSGRRYAWTQPGTSIYFEAG